MGGTCFSSFTKNADDSVFHGKRQEKHSKVIDEDIKPAIESKSIQEANSITGKEIKPEPSEKEQDIVYHNNLPAENKNESLQFQTDVETEHKGVPEIIPGPEEEFNRKTPLKDVQDKIICKNQKTEEVYEDKENEEIEKVNENNVIEETIARDSYILESLEKIEEIRKNIDNISLEVESFSGTKEDKTFLNLKERLIRNVLKLDDIESKRNTVIRETRKEAVQKVNKILADLINRCS